MSSPWEDGNPEAKICILTDAPGRSEVRLRKPLVGPSGQLFDDCLHRAKMVRRECYIVSVFPDTIKKDKSGKTAYDRNGDILWTAKNGLSEKGQEIAANSLKRVSDSSANVVVPLGNIALSCVFGDDRIMKWRGSILEGTEIIGQKKVVPTVDPTACLRGQYLWRHLLISDLDKARQESKTEELNLLERDLIVGPGFSDVVSFLKECLKAPEVGFDIECTNHQVHCFSFATTPTRCMSVPIVKANGSDYWSLEQEEEIWLLVARILGDPTIAKVMQNGIFDTGFMLQQMNIHTRGPLYDTMVLHHIMFPDFPKGLDFLCSMHTREPYYKDEGKMWKNPGANIEQFWRYNAKDSATTLEIWNALWPDAKEQGFERCYTDTVDMFPALLYMMIRGFPIDTERLAETNEEVTKKIKEAHEKLREVSDYEFNPASPKQCQEYFYVHKGLKPYVSRTTGRPTTDDKAMSRILRKGHQEARYVQEIRALSKLHGTYLEVSFDKDNRVRCSYNPRGATTGRLSSSKTIFGTGLNLQNLHPDFKGFMVASQEE
jgi:uracil-DNA glycosylase